MLLRHINRHSRNGARGVRRSGAHAGRMGAALLVAVLVGGLSAWMPARAAAQTSTEGALAWLWSNEPETDAYSPDARYQFNSTGADNAVTRTAAGEYTATFPGVGKEEGVFQVTGQGEAASRTIARWVLDGEEMNVEVRCFAADGAAVDSGFLVSYNIAP